MGEERKEGVRMSIETQMVRAVLTAPGFRESLEGECESCGLARTECYDNVLKGLEEEERKEQLDEFPSLRSHDYPQPIIGGDTPLTTVKDKLYGLKSDLNNALDEVDNLIESLG